MTLQSAPGLFQMLPFDTVIQVVQLTEVHTRIVTQLGHPNWDDIKILGHQMGHLISNFQNQWDSGSGEHWYHIIIE